MAITDRQKGWITGPAGQSMDLVNNASRWVTSLPGRSARRTYNWAIAPTPKKKRGSVLAAPKGKGQGAYGGDYATMGPTGKKYKKPKILSNEQLSEFAALTRTNAARDLMNNGPGADKYSGPVAQYNPDGTVVGQEPPPAAPPAYSGGGGGGAYATPNYSQQAQDSAARVNSVYDEAAKRLALLNQQRQQANAFTNQDVAASGAQRFAEMQQQLGMGYQDDATRSAAALQLDGLRNNNQAQDEYSRRMGQMDQLDYNTALGQNSSNRAASQLGIMQDVAAQRAAAASGGGGGGGAVDGGAFTDSAISARLALLNAGQPKYKSAVDLMMDKYGQLDGNSKLVASVRDRVKMAKGSNIASLRQFYGKKHKNHKGGMVYDNPKVMELLDQAQIDRRAHHSANQYTAEDAIRALTAERGF